MIKREKDLHEEYQGCEDDGDGDYPEIASVLS
jgi:hypothetical protein